MDPMSPLLRLPGELRNRIYAYTLSEPRGICYREDENGIIWLCLHESTTNVQENAQVDALAATAEEEVTEETGRAKRRKLNNGSIRNVRIDPKLVTKDIRVRACGNLYIIANQMAFVSRQLRFETKGLSLRYNVLYMFEHSFQDLLKLCKSLAKQQRGWLEVVKLKPDSRPTERPNIRNELLAIRESESDENTLVLTELVSNCPRLSIHIHEPLRNSAAKDFLLNAFGTQCFGRGNISFIDRLTSDVLIRSHLKKQVEQNSNRAIRIAPCIKSFPAEEVFDEAKFRKNCAERDEFAEFLRIGTDYDIEKLVMIAREWYLYGF